MPYAAFIPMPTIAAILFMVAYNMCKWRPFVKLVKTAPKSDILVLVVTFVLTVVFDLVVAIGVGMVLACLLFMKRMSDETSLKSWKYVDDEDDPDSISLRKVPQAVRVYEITGPLFFGMASRIPDIDVKDYTKVLVLRMRGVPAIDASAVNALETLVKKCREGGIRLVLSHVNEQPMSALLKNGLLDSIGQENVCVHIDAALMCAEQILKEGQVSLSGEQ